MATYLQFLQWLVSIGGEKLPRILAFLQAEMDLLSQYQDILSTKPNHAASETTPEECALESEVVSLSHTHGAIGDGSLLKTLFNFLSAHPELLTLLLSLIKK